MNLLTDRWSWMRGHAKWLENSTEHLALSMVREQFNNDEQVQLWRKQGHMPRTGAMFDMRNTNQPQLTQRLVEFANSYNLEHVGVSYYRMDPGDNLPYHSDLYSKYISLFSLEQRKQNIVRMIFFPENRKPGHIFEIEGTLVDWKSGDWIAWCYDVPHLAANIGTEPRYSIQVTGVLREGI